MNKKFILLLALCCFYTEGSQGTLDDKLKRGYWWGEKVEPIDKEAEEYPIPPPNPKTDELLKMHPSKLREMEEQYREYAIWVKTPEATRDYWTVVDAARRQARSFTALTAVTMLQNPELNARTQNPITNAGRAAKRQLRDNSVNKRLIEVRDDFALVMFTQPGCPYCELQRNTLKFFTEKHYWPYKEIDITRNPSLAERFNVTTTPVTILVKKDTDKWMNIAVGPESVPNIEDNAYRAVRLMSGETTPQQFYTPEYMDGGFFDPQPKGLSK
ncbi:conjugal transfer protein TraF [Pseudoalteromonas galatheae]|uniref:conjugal transfer protein TraF n=1 Tax=Pseudoalteromonas galatheae TaxID=579562 RepID=UPI0030CFD5A4